jgi:hypothetical protein
MTGDSSAHIARHWNVRGGVPLADHAAQASDRLNIIAVQRLWSP